MTQTSINQIHDVLLSLIEYNRVNYAQNDRRLLLTRDAYIEFCQATGRDPKTVK